MPDGPEAALKKIVLSLFGKHCPVFSGWAISLMLETVKIPSGIVTDLLLSDLRSAGSLCNLGQHRQ